MDVIEETEARDALEKIEAALPDDDVRALTFLLTASAAKAVDSGISDARAVSGFIDALKSIRSLISRRRAH